MKRVALGVQCILLGVLGMDCSKQLPAKLATVEVDLGAPVDSIKGSTWPRFKNGALSDVHAIESPRQVILTFPTQHRHSIYSKLTIIDEQDGKLSDVSVMPFEQALPYERAATEVAHLTAEIERLFAVEPKDSVQKEVLGWKGTKPEFYHSFRLEIAQGITVFVKLESADRDREKWFVSIMFSYRKPKKQ